MENSREDPRDAIAIIGMGCRLPGGVNSPEAFWNALVDGLDAIGEVPADRWAHYRDASQDNAAALRRTTGLGGFVSEVDGFDAAFFGISPREAALMDPQQRMALEVSWEALEHAGIVPGALAGTDTGVFVGVNTDDHGRRLLEDLPRIEAWTGIGSSMCAVANRVSYTLDLRGPSLVVDTACSSSLVALHLACQSLRLGETPVAIAGGVMLMLAPGLTMVMDAAGALAPDGRSKSFDASADGYGRGEGCGMVVLKRLADARRDGDRVLAVVRGSAVNQDGRTNGIMAPSREAQEHMLRQACTQAGVTPESVDYVEAHGTGTRAGDPIEAGAIASVYGVGRPADRPCLIGSVKSNIGHLEAASGIAGVIKAVLAIEHAAIPPSLNLTTPNPDIPWQDSGLRVVTELTRWPSTGGPRRAGVSGYGYGGTIAHLVLEQAPGARAVPAPDRGTALRVYPLSGNTVEAVRDYAATLADRLTADAALELADVAHTLADRRAHLTHRGAVLAAGRDELVARLRQIPLGEPRDGLVTGQVLDGARRGAVWVFSGHGSQWIGMGRELLGTEPEFGAVLDELEPICLAELGVSPRRALLEGDLLHTDRIQLLIFAMQVGLARVLTARGLAPAAVLGHSVGEIAAAVVGGVLDLADGARLICRRSALLRRVAGQGAMAMVNLPFAEVRARLSDVDGVGAAIAAAPSSTVVAGDVAELEVVVKEWTAAGLHVQRVNSDVAFHSHHMDPLVGDLAEAVADLAPRAGAVPVYSTSLEDPRGRDVRDGAYWAGNLRNPVRFAGAVSAALADGYRAFVEIAPHPVVSYSINEVLAAEGVTDAVVAHTLRRNRPEQASLLTNLAALHCHGVPVDFSGQGGGLVELPVIAWRHRAHRVDQRASATVHSRLHDVDGHTLLGAPLTVHGTSAVRLWQTWLDLDSRPYPGDHPVQGTEIVPAAVLLTTFLAAAGGHALADVSLRVPVSPALARELQVVQMDGTLRLCSRLGAERDSEPDAGWLTHTTAVVPPVAETPGAETLPLARLRDRCTERLDPNYVIDRLASLGVAAMGFPWRVERIRRGAGELFVRVLADPDDTLPPTWASILDAALSAASVVFDGQATLRMPAAIRRVTVGGHPPAEAVISVRVRPGSADTVDVTVASPDGTVVATLTGLRYGVLDGDIGAPASPRRLVHHVEWRPYELPSRPRGALEGVVFVGDAGLAARLGDSFADAGVPWESVADPSTLEELRPGQGTAVLVAAPAGTDAAAATWLLTRTAQVLAGWDTAPTLWCLTRGVREAASLDAVAESALWGAGRVLGGEYPAFWGGIVDLSATDPVGSAGLLRLLLTARPAEDVLSLRHADLAVARLAPVDGAPTRPPLTCHPGGTYLVTGGLGVLGLEVAGWLAGRGARRLVLAGRQALPPRTEWDRATDPDLVRRIEGVRALEAAGVTVATLALDVADPAQAARELSAATLGLPRIRGVVHAAGVLDNRLAGEVDHASLERVLAPKAGGALVLHELFPPGSLEFLVLFSSAGQLLGLPGQTSYAAANAVLDGLARHRGDALSLAWTSWRGLGMSTSSAAIDAELAARGTGDITAEEAFRAWEYAQRQPVDHVAVLRTVPTLPGMRRPPLLAELTADQAPAPATTGTPWAGLRDGELREYLAGEVAAQVAAELKLAVDELDVRRPLIEMGLDSVMTQLIRGRLERQFRVSLPATLLWNSPTVRAISDFLAELLAGESLMGEDRTNAA
ncbi:beta-ketoacyl synthase [Actinophytocola xinjiangensis]|uniref:Beta-ketoacyl synthase n=1 Tax=Actinophytocola xinjiangensis TaxID=485602 RepID=A0A7Z0WF18_9PSEU|nr:type I polyketide synthase [Actinophytocola xinjiangensis]OLF05828.1 beta-ketoacyl synthase [Actinophytocola xinjiangensis]